MYYSINVIMNWVEILNLHNFLGKVRNDWKFDGNPNCIQYDGQ